jgi:hypothetical protein
MSFKRLRSASVQPACSIMLLRVLGAKVSDGL